MGDAKRSNELTQIKLRAGPFTYTTARKRVCNQMAKPGL